MLAVTLSDHTACKDLSTRHLAGVVLKNTLRNHIIELKSKSEIELDQVKQCLFSFLVQSNPLALTTAGPERKVIKEALLILCKVIVSEFNNNTEDCQLFYIVLKDFCTLYNPILVRLVYQVLKEADDDRMSKFAAPILQSCSNYLSLSNDDSPLS